MSITRRFPAGPAIAALALWLASAANAQPAAAGNRPDEAVRFSGSVRSRVEAWNWFDAQAGENRYGYLGSQIRFGWTQRLSRVDWQIELMAPVLLGLPENAVAPAPLGQLGLGGAYFTANDNSRNAVMLFPKQAWVRLKTGSQSLRLGRFEWMEGAELAPRDATLAALKRDRIAQRLLAPFGWTHVGRSFDGVHYSLDGPSSNFTVVGAFPTRGVFQVDGWGRMNTAFVYASANRGYASGRYTGDVRGFGIYYHDWRQVLKTDSRPLEARRQDLANIRVFSLGGHSIGKLALPGGDLDLLLWGLLQTGRWGRLDHRAGAAALEGGYQPGFGRAWQLWVRGGYNYASGDRDPGDSKHGTFVQMLPTPRPYARFPFFNLMNNQDSFVSLLGKPWRPLQLRADVHWLRLASRRDLWYLGGGAFQPWAFGFIGRPSGGAARLANLYDLSADWNVNPRVTLSGYFGFADGKRVIRSVYPEGARGALGYAEIVYRF